VSAKKGLAWLQTLPPPGGRCLSDEYVNVMSKYKWQCDKGHIWLATANNVQQGKWCPNCAGVVTKDLRHIQNLARNMGGRCLSTEYINARTKYEWECARSHTWLATANNVQKGTWCPSCSGDGPNQKSMPEYQMFEHIKSQFPDARNRVRGLLKSRRFELDIYVPSLEKAIEFDGDHWHHSEWAKARGVPERDARKDAQCLEAGIELLRVRWSDYIRDPEVALRRCSSFLNKAHSPA
jgi:hypothetical protein